jgi:hypothetical protein
MTDLRPDHTASGLEDEAQVIAMCRALNECAVLESHLLRACSYIDAGFESLNWDFDTEAVRRQQIWRRLENAK